MYALSGLGLEGGVSWHLSFLVNLWDTMSSLMINMGKHCGRGNYIMIKWWIVTVHVGDHLETLIQCAYVPGSPCVCVILYAHNTHLGSPFCYVFLFVVSDFVGFENLY